MSKESLKEVLVSSEFVILTAGAEWCGYCQKFKSVFEEVAKEHGTQYKFARVNVQEEVDFPKHHNINGFPTTLFMKDGAEVGREVGYMSKEAFTASIKKHFN